MKNRSENRHRLSRVIAAVLWGVLSGCGGISHTDSRPPAGPVPTQGNIATAGLRTKSPPASELQAYAPVVSPISPPASGFLSFLFDGGGEPDREAYAPVEDNPFHTVKNEPLSTFSIDVDTASYANIRRLIREGKKVPPGAVRIEEMVNYFDYNYPEPRGAVPFSVSTEIAGCPWTPKHRLLRIGLRGKEMPEKDLPPANLVFLLDVSGSMSAANKLPLVKSSLRLLLKELDPQDRIAVVVYAGASGVALESTAVGDRQKILEAIDKLEAGGSTAGAQGIELAYKIAEQHKRPGRNNRIILATDGDFNVGTTDNSQLERLIREKARGGIFLTVLGYGMGNYQDDRLELLADKGNGNYAYIDTLQEARKVLVREMGSTLLTIAKDVKVQVEFNPAQVAGYRLIGYENRKLEHQDFNDDGKDAGEIGAGHTVTAFYEIIPAGQKVPATGIDALKYTTPGQAADAALADQVAAVKLRYKAPNGTRSQLVQVEVRDGGKSFEQADQDFQFGAAVAAFGMRLRDSEYKGNTSNRRIRDWAKGGLARDPNGERSEFLTLVR
jgi:Ca-activated chloride channel homolog